MAKIQRVTHKIFGSGGSTDNFGEFGSLVAGAPLTTKDITVIQNLPAWTSGFQAEVYTGNKALLLEDLNGCMYEHSMQVADIFEMGVPEWDAGTTYYIGSYVRKVGTKQLYCSLTDANLNNALPAGVSNAIWEYFNPPSVQDVSLTAGAIPVVLAAAVAGASPATLTPGHLSQDANYVITAKPVKFSDGTAQTTASVPVTAQSDVKASRAMDAIFQNTSGKAMFVAVTIDSISSGSAWKAETGPASPPTVLVAQTGQTAASANKLQIFFIVLPGYYYKVSTVQGTPSIVAWVEWT